VELAHLGGEKSVGHPDAAADIERTRRCGIADVYTVSGWASLSVAVAFLGGVQLTVLGLIGEYIARIYDEVKQRPLYLVREQLDAS
jgi:hypothetical protein